MIQKKTILRTGKRKKSVIPRRTLYEKLQHEIGRERESRKKAVKQLKDKVIDKREKGFKSRVKKSYKGFVRGSFHKMKKGKVTL